MPMADIKALISSKIRVEILRILSLSTDSKYNINELSRMTAFSPRGVEKELKNLLDGGILKKEVSGNQHRYQLDPYCPIYLEIKNLIVKTVGITDVIKQALESVAPNIELAFIYGSFATGDYGNDSDIDLFLVTGIAGPKLAELLSDLQNRLGRSINISQFTSDEYRQRVAQKDHFLTRVIEGPRIEIIKKIHES
jgi:predicted nucleotidyltransferase